MTQIRLNAARLLATAASIAFLAVAPTVHADTLQDISKQIKLGQHALALEQVDKYLVAHGAGSGRGDTAEEFSDRNRSHQTSLGIYITGTEYDGKHGRSLKLEGKENSNDSAESRSVVLHGASYVSDEYAKENGRVGNSWGCPAVDYRYRDEIIDKIGNGSVMLIYAT